jgi:hypothetical protein
MTTSKTFLSVPYVDKDAAKALGARWDADIKKWYVPATIDIAPFAKWYLDAASLELPTSTLGKAKVRVLSPKNSLSANNSAAGVTTHPADKGFVAYNDDEPPWN